MAEQSEVKGRTEGPSRQPEILVRVSDLYFASRIDSTARALGCSITWIDAGSGGEGPAIPLGEGEMPLDPDVDALQPGFAGCRLAIVDLNQAGAVEWIQDIRNSPAGETVEVVAFGSHKDTETLAAARRAGASRVLARSKFVEILPEILGSKAP